MKLHPDKCKVMHLGRDNPQTSYSLKREDGSSHTLETTNQEKDLGVLIDDQLKYTAHITSQVNKANRALGLIKHTFKYMDMRAFQLLYKSLIRPHLEYASPVWAAVTKRDQDLLERVQRRATRLVPQLSRLGYSERLEELGLPTLSYRRQRADMIQLFKITNNMDIINLETVCPICKQKPLQEALAKTTRGHSVKFQVQRNGGPRCHFLTARALQNWNKLSESTVTSKTVNAFKNRLAKDWSNKEDKYAYKFSY